MKVRQTTSQVRRPKDGYTLYHMRMMVFLLAGSMAFGCSTGPGVTVMPAQGESRLASIQQLTSSGQNAEAYFSDDGQWLTFQSAQLDYPCDQQYVMRINGTERRMVSDGRGKTTCGWFFPGGKRLFFGSTTAHQDRCPPKPDPSRGYVWPLDPYDIYTVNRDGSNTKRLTSYDVYTAEGVLSPDGKRIVFTSLESGDLEIYTRSEEHTSELQSQSNLV